MDNTPMFSIIVPVYKVEEYLDRCVKSLLNQTYADIEIILVDDGSPDKCPIMCDEYAARDNRIRVIHKSNGGLSEARNKGIEAAVGEYIMFVDSDDYIDANTCELLLQYTKKTPDVIVTDGDTIGGRINLKHYPLEIGKVYSGKEYVKQCITKGKLPMAACLYIYKRGYLSAKNIFFKKGILHEDEQFTPRALLDADSIIYTGFSCYKYVIRENSITTKKDKRKNVEDLYDTCVELKGIYDALEDKKLRLRLQDLLVRRYLNLFQSSKMYRYKSAYVHRSFVMKNAHCATTKARAVLFCVSPFLYCQISYFFRRM